MAEDSYSGYDAIFSESNYPTDAFGLSMYVLPVMVSTSYDDEVLAYLDFALEYSNGWGYQWERNDYSYPEFWLADDWPSWLAGAEFYQLNVDWGEWDPNFGRRVLKEEARFVRCVKD